MRTLEIRRHSLRSKGSPHLNQAGVDLARLAGSRMGPFDRVVSSMQPRAFETAIAMGFAVDEQTERLDPLGDGVHQHVEWDAGFAAYADAIQHSDGVRQAGQQLRDLLISIAGSLPESGAALIATHGGFRSCAPRPACRMPVSPRWGHISDRAKASAWSTTQRRERSSACGRCACPSRPRRRSQSAHASPGWARPIPHSDRSPPWTKQPPTPPR